MSSKTNAEPDIGLEPKRKSDFEKEVVGKMPGVAVFSSLQFQEYNEGEVNTKQKKKEGRSLFPVPCALV